MEYTDGIVSPRIFRVWSGLATVAASMGRSTSIYIQRQTLYPNLYLLLVGRPGLGKSNAAKFAKSIIADAKTTTLTSEGLSKREFFHQLEQSMKGEPGNPLAISANLYALIEEFGVFLHPQDIDFMRSLAHVFDNPDTFKYDTFHSGGHDIEKACVNMTGCCTLDYIKDMYNASSLESGFPARIILVFSDETIRTPLFDDTDEEEQRVREQRTGLFKILSHDLELISQMRGQFILHKDCKMAIAKWYDAGMPPVPIDQRLTHYNTRRLVLTLKVMMAVAACRSQDLVIMQEDFEAALELMIETEAAMPEAIGALGKSPVYEEIKKCILIIQVEYDRKKRGTPEFRLRHYLLREVSPAMIDHTIDAIVQSKAVFVQGTEKNKRIFFPSTATEAASS